MYKIGMDLVEIKRMERSIQSKHFCKRVFGEREYDELLKRGFPTQSAAACFAAKEAFSKAIGTGIRGFSLNEVEVLHYENGKPYLFLSGNALKMAENLSFDVSITHTDETAGAIVLAFPKKEEE